MNYSFQDQGKWFFNSAVRWAFNKNKQNNQSSLYILEKPEEILMMKEHSTGRTSRPSVDLYFQCKLNNDQSLIINAVTTYIDTQSDRSYTEGKSNEPLTDIYSTVSGNKYSFIGEGIYERKVTKKSRLSAGVKYQQSLADNTYGGNESSETKMHETHATAYVEYSGKMDRFNYSFGLQGSYARFKQKEEGYNRYSLLPRLRLGYQFSDNVFIRYRGQISRKSPGLSDMGNVRQLIDSLQVRSGNPELKIFTVYKNELEAYEELIKHPYRTTEEVIEEKLIESGINLSDNELLDVIEKLHYVDMLAVSYYREKTIKTLVEAGLKVTLYGTGWGVCHLG